MKNPLLLILVVILLVSILGIILIIRSLHKNLVRKKSDKVKANKEIEN